MSLSAVGKHEGICGGRWTMLEPHQLRARGRAYDGMVRCCRLCHVPDNYIKLNESHCMGCILLPIFLSSHYVLVNFHSWASRSDVFHVPERRMAQHQKLPAILTTDIIDSLGNKQSSSPDGGPTYHFYLASRVDERKFDDYEVWRYSHTSDST